MEAIKKKTTELKCSISLEVFSETNDLKKHNLKVHGVKSKFCEELVKDTVLNEQTAFVHAIQCRLCDKSFATNVGMDTHLSSVHLIKCQFCPAKLFTNKDPVIEIASNPSFEQNPNVDENSYKYN